MKVIGNEYMVVVGRTPGGKMIKEQMKLEKIMEYKDQQVYLFTNGMEKFVSYDYKIIDWDFLDEINMKFLGVSIF
ncbi:MULTISPECIES: hypothetical protein [Priestia]|uniref:hypothetical protein n=1 Tax=Priestia TaxID=2800373 RepID=UPI0012B82456|nr:hypothetical protein [Priestia megaterium]